MPASDLAQPLEIACMKAKVYRRPAFRPMIRHRIQARCGDHLIQTRGAEIWGPKEFESRSCKNTVRASGDEPKLLLRILRAEGRAKISQGDLSTMTVKGEERRSNEICQGAYCSPRQQTDQGGGAPKSPVFKTVALALPKRKNTQLIELFRVIHATGPTHPSTCSSSRGKTGFGSPHR